MIEDEADNAGVVEDYQDPDTKAIKTAKEMHVFPITTATITFQAVMIAAAIYYSMLLTNWGNPVYQNSSV